LSRRAFAQSAAVALLAVPSLGANPFLPGLEKEHDVHIEKFRIDVDDATLTDLRVRLKRTRWNDAVTDDWEYGMQRSLLQDLVAYWSGNYDWKLRQAELNQLPHFRATIDGFSIHFLHFKGRGPSPQPLLLMNGWPSSFVEYRKLAPMLADPARFGGDSADAFDVIIPALPGFGFSDRPKHPRDALRGVELFFRLMTEGLGYSRFVAAGTDIGAGVATRLGLTHPEAVTAIHVTSITNPPMDVHSPPLTPAEQAYQESYNRWNEEEGAYSAIQSTRPQTLAFGLADSPTGLASWIVEKFRFWSDCNGDVLSMFSMDMLIDNLMVYWVSATIGSSVRYYYEATHYRPPFKVGDFVKVPTAVLMLPKDLLNAPREWAERFYHVKRYTAAEHGGHFPAWETPDFYANDLRKFFRAS
jgi:microsomal epoxide hydrolase